MWTAHETNGNVLIRAGTERHFIDDNQDKTSIVFGSCLDPEIDRVGRSSRSFDVGVELSRKSRRKLS